MDQLYNTYGLDAFTKEENITKFKLKDFEDFKELRFINSKRISKRISMNLNNEEDKYSIISLIKEKYSKENYKFKEYPFYEYFYYSDFLDERYISKRLNHIDINKYPLLKMYLEQKNNKDENKYTLENLSLFNNTLNLIKEKYFDKIRREYAEKIYMENTKLYKENEILINEFIKFYNSLKIKDKNDKIIELSKDNHLSDFFVDEKNTIGATYKNIYKEFIKIYNKKNEYLFDIKRINKKKICIQNFQENEIFMIYFMIRLIGKYQKSILLILTKSKKE